MLPMRFGCVFAGHTRGGPAWWLLPVWFGLRVPWRCPAVRVALGDGQEGWAVLLPAGSSPRRVRDTVAWLVRRGVKDVSVSPRFGVPGRGLALWMAATLRVALLMASRGGTPARALVVGTHTMVGQTALGWLASRVRHLSVGQSPDRKQTLVGDRLLDDLGVAVTWDPVDVPGPRWEGDLVVWAGGSVPLRREVCAPVWLQAGASLPTEAGRPVWGTVLVVDALLRGVEMKGIPAWWWRELRPPGEAQTVDRQGPGGVHQQVGVQNSPCQNGGVSGLPGQSVSDALASSLEVRASAVAAARRVWAKGHSVLDTQLPWLTWCLLPSCLRTRLAAGEPFTPS